MKFRPKGNIIQFEPIEEAKVTAGGILLPDRAQDKPQKGTVLSVGPGQRSITGDIIPVDQQVGDIISFYRHAVVEIKIDTNKSIFLISEGDVLGTFEDVDTAI